MAFFISNFWLSRSSSDQLFDTLLHFSPAPTARAHRAAAAFRASSFRCFGVRDAMRALPPIGPPFLPSFDRWRRNASSSFIGTMLERIWLGCQAEMGNANGRHIRTMLRTGNGADERRYYQEPGPLGQPHLSPQFSHQYGLQKLESDSASFRHDRRSSFSPNTVVLGGREELVPLPREVPGNSHRAAVSEGRDIVRSDKARIPQKPDVKTDLFMRVPINIELRSIGMLLGFHPN